MTLIFFIAGVTIGRLWDLAWHITNPFEDFFSPPHLFIAVVSEKTSRFGGWMKAND